MALISKNDRKVFQWYVRADVYPNAAKNDGKTATIDEIISVLESEIGRGRARIYLGKEGKALDLGDPSQDEKNQLYIAAIDRSDDGKYATLLINRGDPNTVLPTFVDVNNNTVRTAVAGPKETLGWSAHLVISLKPEKEKHRACLEQIPHVSGSVILSCIDRIVERALSDNPMYTYEVPKSKKLGPQIQRPSYRPQFYVQRVPSERVSESIKTGTLKGVTLTKKTAKYNGPGAEKTVKSTEQKLVVMIAPEKDKTVIQTLLQGLIGYAKEHDFSQVSLKITDGTGDSTRSPTIDVDDLNALEHLYVKSTLLTDFSGDLRQCYTAPNAELVIKMHKLIENNGRWA